METTEGALLGGRVRYAQPARGFRSGIEPVLLAAAVPASPGAWVLEAGTGAGAGLLCLAARVALGFGLGVERDPELAALAARNAAANALPLGFVAADILAFRPEDWAAKVAPGNSATSKSPFPRKREPRAASTMPHPWVPAFAGMTRNGRPDPEFRGTIPERGFDHAFANPPYHPDSGTVSSEARRRDAKRAPVGLVTEWAATLGDMLRPGGTLSLILPPARLPEALEGCAQARCGSARLLPLWPKPGRAAKLVILQAVRDGRGALALLPGLVLHRPDGGFTEAAESVLRAGLALTCQDVTNAADRNTE